MSEQENETGTGGSDVVPKGKKSDMAQRDSDAALARFLSSATEQAPVDPAAATMDIIRRILAGDTAEDVLQQQAALHARDFINDPLTILGYTYNESDFEQGPKFYMVIDAVTSDGESAKITCGALNVMAQLFRLNELKAFPIKARIVETGKATKAGYKPMWLEAVPADF